MKDKTIEHDDRYVKCDECKNNVDCDKHSIHNLLYLINLRGNS